jgi:hypothetical protein
VESAVTGRHDGDDLMGPQNACVDFARSESHGKPPAVIALSTSARSRSSHRAHRRSSSLRSARNANRVRT